MTIQHEGYASVSGVRAADGELFVHLLLICLCEIQFPYFDGACTAAGPRVRWSPMGWFAMHLG